MMPTGSDSGNSGSGSWLKYLKGSPESVGQGPENSQGGEPENLRSNEDLDWRSGPPTGPKNSPTSSFFEGVSDEFRKHDHGSEATSVDQGPNKNEAGCEGEAPGQPAGVREPEAPTIEDLKKKIQLVLRGHRRVRCDVMKRLVEQDLRLETASTQKLICINEVLEYISANREDLLNSGESLVNVLTVKTNDWEREQRHFPNPELRDRREE